MTVLSSKSPVPALLHALRVVRLVGIRPASREKAVGLFRELYDLFGKGVLPAQVHTQWAYVCASLMKVSWPMLRDSDSTRALFNSAPAPFLVALVAEMDFVSCSSTGLSLDTHLLCHMDFQFLHLPSLLQRSLQLCIQSTNMASMQPATMGLLDCLLRWHWRKPVAADAVTKDFIFDGNTKWTPPGAVSSMIVQNASGLFSALASAFSSNGKQENQQQNNLRLVVLSCVWRLMGMQMEQDNNGANHQMHRFVAQWIVSFMGSKMVNAPAAYLVPFCNLVAKFCSMNSAHVDVLYATPQHVSCMMDFLVTAIGVAQDRFLDVCEDVFTCALMLQRNVEVYPRFCVALFTKFIQIAAQRYANEVLDQSEQVGDLMVAVARVGRVAPVPSLVALGNLLENSSASSMEVRSAVIYLLGYFLCDDARVEATTIFPGFCASVESVAIVVNLVQGVKTLAMQVATLRPAALWFFDRWAPSFLCCSEVAYGDHFGKGPAGTRFLEQVLVEFLLASLSNASSRQELLLSSLLFRTLCLHASIGPSLTRCKKWNLLVEACCRALHRMGDDLLASAGNHLMYGIFGSTRYLKLEVERENALKSNMTVLSRIEKRNKTRFLLRVVKAFVMSVPLKLAPVASAMFTETLAAFQQAGAIHTVRAMWYFFQSDLCSGANNNAAVDMLMRILSGISPADRSSESLIRTVMKIVSRLNDILSSSPQAYRQAVVSQLAPWISLASTTMNDDTVLDQALASLLLLHPPSSSSLLTESHSLMSMILSRVHIPHITRACVVCAPIMGPPFVLQCVRNVLMCVQNSSSFTRTMAHDMGPLLEMCPVQVLEGTLSTLLTNQQPSAALRQATSTRPMVGETVLITFRNQAFLK